MRILTIKPYCNSLHDNSIKNLLQYRLFTLNLIRFDGEKALSAKSNFMRTVQHVMINISFLL